MEGLAPPSLRAGRLIDSRAMADGQSPCPQCGTPLSPEAKFCGQCGYDLVKRPPPQPAGAKQTMLGMPATPAPGASGQGAPGGPASGPTPKGTMLGMPAVAAPASGEGPAAPTSPAAPTPAEAPPAGGAGGGGRDWAKTVPDTPAFTPPLEAPPDAAGFAPAGAAPPKAKAKPQTMLGMPAVAPPSGGAAPEPQGPGGASSHDPGQAASPPAGDAAPQQAAPPSAAPPPAGGAKPAPNTQRTMLGMPAQTAGGAAPAPPGGGAAAAPAGQPKPAPTTNRTMLGAAPPAGAPAQAPAGAPAPAAQAAPGAPAAAPDASWDDVPAGLPAKKKGGRGLTILAIVLLLAAVAGGAATFYLLSQGDAEVQASVGQSERGEVLVVDVPGAEPGTKVRFGGEERPLEAGRAEFPLEATDLRLGDNELQIGVVAPDGSVDQVTVLLSLRFRVRADLSALEQDPPVLRVVVDAVPGADITLDEQAVALDATGHATQDYPLEDTTGEAPLFEKTVHYRVVLPDGSAPAEGDVAVRIPFATLQVDRPGERAITDQRTVEVAGAAHPEATVTLDGSELELREGRFVTQLVLDAMGESEHVLVARRPGRAPRRRVLHIRRVEDLAAEAASYPVEELPYARIASSPDTYRGRRVAFVGRVYNVDVHEGRSVLQIVLRDCPGSQRCPLWVTYDGATEAGLNTWVRVLGELAGEQQFRSPSGQVMSVPRLDAAFVLPAPSSSRRR